MKLLGFWAVNQPGGKRTKDEKAGREGGKGSYTLRKELEREKLAFYSQRNIPLDSNAWVYDKKICS